MPLRYLTAGDSHGPGLMGILEGVPAGLDLSVEGINADLRRRRSGHGRSSRQQIETDDARVVSGLYRGKTTGAPIGIYLENSGAKPEDLATPVYTPRPGHADLAGMLKYDLPDARPIWERASARETAMRVALGAVAKQILESIGAAVFSRVIGIGEVFSYLAPARDLIDFDDIRQVHLDAERSPVRCAEKSTSDNMIKAIDQASSDGDSLGGSIEVLVPNLPIGLGSHVHWDRRLDTRLAGALMSIPSAKSVEIGENTSSLPGSESQDQIFSLGGKSYRRTNIAGGLEGGISNGMPVVARVFFKPLPTIRNSLFTVNVQTGKEEVADYLRSDICVVPAGSVIAEAVCALVLGDAILESFGDDTMANIIERVKQKKSRA